MIDTNSNEFQSGKIKGKLGYLMISFILMIVLYPFLETGPTQTIFWNILLSIVLFFGVYAVSYSKKNFIIALVFALPWFILAWIEQVTSPLSLITGVISLVSIILFFTFTLTVIFNFVLKSRQINKEVLYGAVRIYLLLGGIFTLIYFLIEILQPGSFFINPVYNADTIISGVDFMYYSFSTLTTLGYGDVIPVTSHARSFAILEAVLGVMYLAIIISRLVGMYIAQVKKE
jgi:hypothetical protein